MSNDRDAILDAVPLMQNLKRGAKDRVAPPDVWLPPRETVDIRTIGLDMSGWIPADPLAASMGSILAHEMPRARGRGVFARGGGTDPREAFNLVTQMLDELSLDASRRCGEQMAAECRDGIASPASAMRRLRLRGASGAGFSIAGRMWS
jgi:hypothetical protein